MAFKLPKPTGKSIRDFHARAFKEWQPAIKKDEGLRDLVHQMNIIEPLPESNDQNMRQIDLHSGRAGGIIEHASGLLMARPDLHAEPISLVTEDQRMAEQVERVAAAMFERELILNDFWPAVGRDMLIYGRAFLKSMPLQAAWTTQEGMPVRGAKDTSEEYLEKIRKWKESEGKFPFIIQHIPVLSILPMLNNNDQVMATVEVKYVNAKVLADEMGSTVVSDLLRRRVIKWYDELPVVEYIDTEWVAYALGGTEPRDRGRSEPLHTGKKKYELLRAWKHGLGKHPVVMVPGIRTELPEYQFHFKSFLGDAKEALETYDFLLSRLASMVWAYYLPSYEWKLVASSAQFSGRDRPILTVNLGGVTVTYADETLDTLPIPQGLPDATMLLQQCDDIIQRHTLEDVLFGRVQGAAPAYQVNLRINVAKSKLSPLAQHLAVGATEVIDRFLRGVEQLGEAIVIEGERITVAMAKEYRGRVTASIQPKSPVDRSQDIGAANMAYEFGLPWDWIVENILDISDPATLRLMKDIQELEELPPVKERLMQEALEQLELLVEEDEMEELSEIDMGELPPEFAEAAAQLLGGGGAIPEAGAEAMLPALGAGIPTPRGLGRGPFPTGAAPQTLAPRGLRTPNRQPEPGIPQVGEAESLQI